MKSQRILALVLICEKYKHPLSLLPVTTDNVSKSPAKDPFPAKKSFAEMDLPEIVIVT